MSFATDSGGRRGALGLPLAVAPAVPTAVVGMLVFLGAEAMLFAGLASAFFILRAGISAWPPPGQPQPSVTVSGVNIVVLLASGFTMCQALETIRSGERRALARWLALTALLGATFLAVQGSEWVRVLRFGVTSTRSLYGATFMTLVGIHALHVVSGLGALLVVLSRALRGKYSASDHCGIEVCSLYWCFVVVVWPVLYVLIYLG